MKVKQPKPDPQIKAAQKRQSNQAAEQAQQAAAAKANEALRTTKQGRRQFLFPGTGATGVSSKTGV